MKKWNVKSTEYLFKEPWFTARKDFLELPNGNNIPEYYVLEYPNWVNVIGITTTGQMIMIKQYRHGIEQVSYEICAGVIDNTDTNPIDAAQRELLEETGYGNGNWVEWMVVSANPATHNNFTHCFLATDLVKIADQNLEPTEMLEVELMPVEAVKQLLLDNKIHQSLHAAPLWKYFAEN
jgi:ADP-ribose pyrophosphatase